MKHFQVLGFSHDDQDVSRLEDVVTADMVVMFPIADDSEDLEWVSEIAIFQGYLGNGGIILDEDLVKL